MALERELKVLEGDDGDEDDEENSPLDSSQTLPTLRLNRIIDGFPQRLISSK